MAKLKVKKEPVWFAIVGVRPLAGNDIIPEAKGAHVNIACVSENEESLKATLMENFDHYKFKVFEITDIETENNLSIDNPNNSEKIKLLKEIKEGYRFALGTFFTF